MSMMMVGRVKSIPRAVAGAALLGALLASSAVLEAASPRRLGMAPGSATVAVNRDSGTIAVCEGSTISLVLWPQGVVSTRLEVKGLGAEVVAFASDKLLISVDRDEELPGSLVVMDTAGREVRRWGATERTFPSLTTHLSADGRAIADMIQVNAETRKEFQFPSHYADGTYVLVSETLASRARRVVQLRLAEDSAGKRSTAVPQDMISLGPDDFLVTVGNGSLLRVQSGAKSWAMPGMVRGRPVIADVDLKTGQALIIDGDGAVQLVGLAAGEMRWRWSGCDHAAEVTRVLEQTGFPGALRRLGESVERRLASTNLPMQAPRPSELAERVLYGVDAARLLPNGRVLVASSLAVPYGGRAWMLQLDARGGSLVGDEVLESARPTGDSGSSPAPIRGGEQWQSTLHVLPTGELLLRGSTSWVALGLP
ncbi:MAG: hypothetical protein GX464_13150 [Holophagae bacterium]|nr:hypothetical protein [Holophagae bacterium]